MTRPPPPARAPRATGTHPIAPPTTARTGADYVPSLTVRDVPSHGRSHRVLGRVSGREHHLFSDLEEATFLLLDWSGTVTDIREQFGLPLDDTLRIAATIGVRHPRRPGSAAPHPVTTDLVATLPRAAGPLATGTGPRYVALACKPAAELAKPRVQEKLELERRYWAACGVPWQVVTERDVPADRVANLRWLQGAWRTEGLPLRSARLPSVLDGLADAVAEASTTPLATLCLEADERFGLAPGDCLALAKHAIAVGRWPVDLSTRIDPCRPLALRPAPPNAAPAAVLLAAPGPEAP